MRSVILCTLLFFVFIYLLCFPQEAFQSSASGVTLWFFHVLPSLLPFMIFSDFFIHTGLVSVLLRKIKTVFRFLFGLSMYGSYAFLLGLICGYPMGAKLTADLFREGKITKSEAQYLLTFCNNPGPMFISSYLLTDTLHLSHASGYTFFILYLSLYLTSLIFRLILRPDCRDIAASSDSPSAQTLRHSLSYMVDASIMHAFESVTKLGGYIILFSILASLVVRLTAPVPVLSVFLTGFTEMTTGIALVGTSSMPPLPSFPDFCLFWWIFLYSTNKGNALRHSPLDSHLYCRKNSSWNLYPACRLAFTLRPDLPVKHLLLQFLLLSPHRIPVVPVRICSVLLHHSNSEWM